MCISNEKILEILKYQERRRQARIRYCMKVRDGNNRLIAPTKEDAIRIVDHHHRTQISYEESLLNKSYYDWWNSKPDIVKTKCPIPYYPSMPLTTCLVCKAKERRNDF